MKTCLRCKESKPKTTEYFSKQKTWFSSYCKECHSQMCKEYYAETKEKRKGYYKEYRDREEVKKRSQLRLLRLKYDLSEEGYKSLWDAQKGRCKICEKDLGEIRPVIDHDHVSGKVRGLLCSKCNLGLGHFEDNPDLLLLACDYLLDFQEITTGVKYP